MRKCETSCDSVSARVLCVLMCCAPFGGASSHAFHACVWVSSCDHAFAYGMRFGISCFPGVRAQRDLQPVACGSIVKCTLDCDAHTFSYTVDRSETVHVLDGLPAGRVFYPAAAATATLARVLILEYFSIPHIRFVVRTRVMCLSGRARAAHARRRLGVVLWLCERAPLWVVVHVCALLRDD